MPDNELLVIEKESIPELFNPGGTEPLLNKLRAEADAYKADISTKLGRNALKSFAFKFTKAKTDIVKMGKNLVEDARKTIKATDAECRRYGLEVDAIRDKVRKPLTEWEEIDKQRIAQIEEELKVFSVFEEREYTESSQVKEALEYLHGVNITEEIDPFFMEFTQIAIKAKSRVITHLTAKNIVLKKEEDDAAEAERLENERIENERIEREKKIAEEAAQMAKEAAEEKARKEAEEKERLAEEAANKAKRDAEEKDRLAKEAIAKAEAGRLAAKAATAKAEKDKKEAAAKAIKDAEEAKIKAEKDMADAIKAEKDKQVAAAKAEKDAEAKRQADKEHRERIMIHIIQDLFNHVQKEGYTEPMLKDIATAIVDGKIRHVKVIF